MAFQDFLRQFAAQQKLESVEELLEQHSDRYQSQLRSRERAKTQYNALLAAFGESLNTMRVLHIGCVYGSLAIELAQHGAHVVGADPSERWLELARVHAQGEVDCAFVRADLSLAGGAKALAEHGPFDLFLLQDGVERIYDLSVTLANIRELAAPNAKVYYRIANGLNPQAVLAEPHKKQFGLSLLPPDAWSLFVPAGSGIYYWREAHYKMLFQGAGFTLGAELTRVTDESLEATRKALRIDMSAIKRQLKAENFPEPGQYRALRDRVRPYLDELTADMADLDWEPLWLKYRASHWTGVMSLSGAQA